MWELFAGVNYERRTAAGALTPSQHGRSVGGLSHSLKIIVKCAPTSLLMVLVLTRTASLAPPRPPFALVSVPAP